MSPEFGCRRFGITIESLILTNPYFSNITKLEFRKEPLHYIETKLPQLRPRLTGRNTADRSDIFLPTHKNSQTGHRLGKDSEQYPPSETVSELSIQHLFLSI